MIRIPLIPPLLALVLLASGCSESPVPPGVDDTVAGVADGSDGSDDATAPETTSDTGAADADPDSRVDPDVEPTSDVADVGATDTDAAIDDEDAGAEIDTPAPGTDAEIVEGDCGPCDDGRECTVDLCDDLGECVHEIAAESCLIGNVCYVAAAAHADNACVVCSPEESQSEWSLAADGAACGEADPCLTGGSCSAGQCDASPTDCDDDNACTDDSCQTASGCVHSGNFDPCEDGDPCTLQDYCSAGECVPSLLPLLCDDDQPCTNDVCGPQGCVFVPKAGLCSDGTACTVGDFCQKAKCYAGTPLACDDGNTCTIDKCDPNLACVYELVDSPCCVGGLSVCDDQNPCTDDDCVESSLTCTHVPNGASCDDGLPCTGPDQCADLECSGPPLVCDDSNPCTADSCSDALGGCQHTGLDAPCDDSNACTSADGCIGGTCIGAPLSCSDGEACTKDSCHPVDGCLYEWLTGECNDGNACTVATVCTEAGCLGSPKDCDDANPCTNDSCHPAAGCKYQALGAPCDDGLDCSTGDHCVAGTCVGDTAECGCLPDFSDTVSKLTLFNVGPDGYPGSGLDVDGDSATCAPSGKCSTGVDNQLSGFAFLANEPLDESVSEGKIVLLFEHSAFIANGLPYTIRFWPADDIKGDSCDLQTEKCDYEVKLEGLDEESCQAMIQFDNAKVAGGQLMAGGQGYQFPLDLPLGDAVLQVLVSNAQIVADVTVVGDQVTWMKGVLAGALPKETMLDGVDQLSDEELAETGFTKDTLKQLLDVIIQNDIDIDADGTPDAASIGLRFEAIAGNIIGLEQ